ncbi:MAG: glycosyltransferase family 2 protein [Burkholderiales bacterium]
MQPSISVVLPVFNCVEYVGEAIDSILAQGYRDFELIVIDDGSTDSTPQIAQQYSDPRMRFYSQENRGLSATLNRGIELAKGKYIARQDQDDVSKPARLGRQAAFLDANPQCALVGTWADVWVDRTPSGRSHRHPTDNEALQYRLLLNNPFVHSSVMLRKDALRVVGGYSTDVERQPPEDFELWSRVARRYQLANIPEILHIYREVPGSMSRVGKAPFVSRLVKICAENIAWASGTDSSNPQIINIAALEHSAAERIGGKPDFGEMSAIFARAAERVTGDRGEFFAKEAAKHVAGLRTRYWELIYGHGWRRNLFRIVRRARRLMLGS